MFRDLQEGLVKRDREINNGKRSDKLSVEEFVETVIKKCPTKKSEDISALKRALAFEVGHHTLYTHCTPYTIHCTLYTAVHISTLTPYTASLYTMHCTLCTMHYALYTVH